MWRKGKKPRKRQEDPGRPRSHPAHRSVPHARQHQGIAGQGSVPSVSADLEAFRRQPDEGREIRNHIGADRRRGIFFTVSASKVVFDGFLSVYTQDEDKKTGVLLAKGLDESTKLTMKELVPEQHFTQPPAHYTEASLVRALEELGIGRPSTYAPTITTLISRHYVAKEKRICTSRSWGKWSTALCCRRFPPLWMCIYSDHGSAAG